jgi:site-specific DNA recombinase
MNTLSTFARFGKTNDKTLRLSEAKMAVVYTRVSSKEQADTNLSLEYQRKAIDDYAQRNNISVAGYFGGTYESAKTDGRKEFQRMLEFIKKNKGKISHVLVYMLDRFSRTGGGAIKLAQELREKHGIEVFAVTQPTDTSNPSGVLQQSIQFIFSQYDNELRKQRSVAGMREKFKRGIWVAKPPIGYDVIKTNGVRKIVINEIGKKIKKAFQWKGGGIKNEAILDRLRSMGVSLNKQHLTKLLKNPFYCGLICHNMLDGEVVEGEHEKLISKELFLKVNEIHQSNSGYGVPHKKQQDELPLKVFIRCSDCNEPFTGYIVKAKGLWYYKCRTKGCKCNKSAKEMHKIFVEFLSGYNIKEELKEPLLRKMEAVWNDINKECYEVEQNYKKQLSVVNGKIEDIEESYYIKKDMNRETYDKFRLRFETELKDINKNLSQLTIGISNPMAAIEKAIGLSVELATEWASGDIDHKNKLQKLVFPEGIVYDKKKGVFRTERVNSIFVEIARLTSVSGKNERRQTGVDSRLSPSVRVEGLEPPSLAAPDPKSGVSTNFTTPAFGTANVYKSELKNHYFCLLKIILFLGP